MRTRNHLLVTVLYSTSLLSSLVLPIEGRTVDIRGELEAVGVQFDLGLIISQIITLLITLGALALLLYFIRGGYLWLTAGGDKAQVENARSSITNAILGLAILASVFAIFTLIDVFFGIGITDGRLGPGSS